MQKRILGVCFFLILIGFISCNTHSDHSSTATQPATIESLKEAIKANPDSLGLVQRLIELYRDNGDYDSAITLTDQQIKKDSGNAFLWNMDATLHFENGDTLKAVRSLENAIAIYPIPDYLVALGTVLAEIQNPRCLVIADSLMEADSIKSAKDAMFIKGLYYSYQRQYPKAIQYFDSSIRKDFTYMPSYREKAIALYQQGNYAHAIKVLTRAVTLENNYDEGYYWLGKCYEKLHRKQDAIQSYQTALLYDKDYLEARQALDSLQKEN
ncbi:MAG: tetratricopeptide repeat protein [Bacteroidota bacterium]|nr:tetratricopeptide repeat protein [Bacteroidota bacterium]